MKYQRNTPRGGSIFSGTVVTTLEIVEEGVAVKVNVWRNAAGEVERVEEPKTVRSAYNFTPKALYRDGYVELA